MTDAGDPVEQALTERRARRAERRREAADAGLTDRCLDAAERRLQVRAHLTGGTVVSGIAVGVRPWSMSLEAATGTGAIPDTHVVLDGIVRLSVGDLGPPAHRTQTRQRSIGFDSLREWLETMASQRRSVRLWTADGAYVAGGIVSVGANLIGLDQSARGARTSGAVGDWTDWLSPTSVVACAELS